MLKKIKLKINGIHCKSCKTLIETEIDVLPGVNRVNVDYISGKAEIEFDDEKIGRKRIFKEIKKLNYEPQIIFSQDDHQEESREKGGQGNFWLGLLVPLLIVFVAGGYFLFSRSGGFEILAKLNEGNVGYGIIFIIGLLAGFHCIGMCGGLVVAYSAAGLKRGGEEKRFMPHLQYNLGRLISYSAIGAVLGGIGSFFGINPIFMGTIILLAGVFMVLMGVSFIKNWRLLEAIKIRTPQFIARFLYNEKHSGKRKGPLFIGLLNGFMPCGPLQAMQLYALASGSLVRGGLSMAIYALGTMPLMFALGSALSTIGQRSLGRIVKVSGVLVLLLGFIMVNRGLTNFGHGFSIGLNKTVAKEQPKNNREQNYQEVKMDLTYLGYKPNVLYIKKGIPVRWVINVKEMSGCTNAIMIESLGIKKNLKYGENIIEFTPPANAKEIKFSCWMRMVWGKFVVVDEEAGGQK